MNSAQITRRSFVSAAVGTAGMLAFAGPVDAQVDAEPDSEPYGPLGEPDANGIRLPAGFTSRVLARSGEQVTGSDYQWHEAPDGGAVFPVEDGDGWIYVSNSEIRSGPTGGVGVLRFDGKGEIVDAYRILEDTLANCAGGPTPWGTWLSCEEHGAGQVWECDPTGEDPAQVRPALGTFVHEAVAVDPENQRLYLTEDLPDGRFYRFTPASWPKLASGTLEVAQLIGQDVAWLEVTDPEAESVPTRNQQPDSTPFTGGEGVWFHEGIVYFTTKGDGRVWQLDTATDRVTVLHEPPTSLPDGSEPVLDGVDNITVSADGEILICEDHAGEQDLVLVGLDGSVGRLLRLTGQPISELTGVAFAPDGERIYFSSQRGTSGLGLTYEVRGPFRETAGGPAATTTTKPAPTTSSPSSSGSEQPTTSAATALAADRADGGDDSGGSNTPYVVGGIGALLAIAAAGAWRIRNRNPELQSQFTDEPGSDTGPLD